MHSQRRGNAPESREVHVSYTRLRCGDGLDTDASQLRKPTDRVSAAKPKAAQRAPS